MPARRPAGAWSAAAAASTGYIRPVNRPSKTPDAIRFANRASRVSETVPAVYPAPNAASSNEAAPPINPTLMGQRRPTRSDATPANICENPLRNE